MTMKEIRERWEESTPYDKSLYIEYLSLCNHASDEDFYYFLHPKESTQAQFLSVLDLLYDQDCYALLFRYLRDNRDRLIFPEFSLIEGMEIREDIEKRFNMYRF